MFVITAGNSWHCGCKVQHPFLPWQEKWVVYVGRITIFILEKCCVPLCLLCGLLQILEMTVIILASLYETPLLITSMQHAGALRTTSNSYTAASRYAMLVRRSTLYIASFPGHPSLSACNIENEGWPGNEANITCVYWLWDSWAQWISNVLLARVARSSPLLHAGDAIHPVLQKWDTMHVNTPVPSQTSLWGGGGGGGEGLGRHMPSHFF
jgi:hypothetical protein